MSNENEGQLRRVRIDAGQAVGGWIAQNKVKSGIVAAGGIICIFILFPMMLRKGEVSPFSDRQEAQYDPSIVENASQQGWEIYTANFEQFVGDEFNSAIWQEAARYQHAAGVEVGNPLNPNCHGVTERECLRSFWLNVSAQLERLHASEGSTYVLEVPKHVAIAALTAQAEGIRRAIETPTIPNAVSSPLTAKRQIDEMYGLMYQQIQQDIEYAQRKQIQEARSY